MSIINLEKTFRNGQLVYCNIDNKIIECICLTKLFKYWKADYDNEDLGTFTCDKVKVITIYDIYKNITYEPIQTNLFKDSIKIGRILENLIGCIKFFKTFIGAFIRNNKINNIKYHINYKGFISYFLYDNILFEKITSIKTFNIYYKERLVHRFEYKKDLIIYKNYNYKIKYKICNNYIKIIKGKYPFYQTICFYTKDLKIYKIDNYDKSIEEIHEIRNNNNEITYLHKYDNIDKIKKEFSFNDKNPPFSKPLRKDYIELIDYYKKNISNCIELMNFLFKKEKIVHQKLLLNYKLEMINFK